MELEISKPSPQIGIGSQNVVIRAMSISSTFYAQVFHTKVFEQHFSSYVLAL
jgi:hypothetical protein